MYVFVIVEVMGNVIEMKISVSNIKTNKYGIRYSIKDIPVVILFCVICVLNVE